VVESSLILVDQSQPMHTTGRHNNWWDMCVCASSKYDMNGALCLNMIWTVVNVGDCHGRPDSETLTLTLNSYEKSCKDPRRLYADSNSLLLQTMMETKRNMIMSRNKKKKNSMPWAGFPKKTTMRARKKKRNSLLRHPQWEESKASALPKYAIAMNSSSVFVFVNRALQKSDSKSRN
jgi:hypothetical protein